MQFFQLTILFLQELDKIINEVKALECDILERKTQVEDYEKELREANLENFTLAPLPAKSPSEGRYPIINLKSFLQVSFNINI